MKKYLKGPGSRNMPTASPLPEPSASRPFFQQSSNSLFKPPICSFSILFRPWRLWSLQYRRPSPLDSRAVELITTAPTILAVLLFAMVVSGYCPQNAEELAVSGRVETLLHGAGAKVDACFRPRVWVTNLRNTTFEAGISFRHFAALPKPLVPRGIGGLVEDKINKESNSVL